MTCILIQVVMMRDQQVNSTQARRITTKELVSMNSKTSKLLDRNWVLVLRLKSDYFELMIQVSLTKNLEKFILRPSDLTQLSSI